MQIFRRTSTGLAPGQIAVGGNHGYIEVLTAAGAHIGFLSVPDVGGSLLQYVTGLAFNPRTGDLFATSTAGLTVPNTDDDVVWFPNNSGLLVAVVPSVGVLELRKYDFDGNVIGSSWTGLDTDFTWAQQPIRLALACDSTTVYYTDSMSTVFRYDLNTSTQLTPYKVRPPGDPYIYSGIAALPGETGDAQDIIVAMTLSGDGPQRCVALASKTEHWVDEIHPSGNYHIQKRRNAVGTLVQAVVTQADPSADNDKTLSIAVLFNPCPSGFRVSAALIT